jgi:hypothetical protein
MVCVDLGGDLGPGGVDGFPFGSPGASLLELTEPRLDEHLRRGVPIAAPAVRDPAVGQVAAEVPGEPPRDSWRLSCALNSARSACYR